MIIVTIVIDSFGPSQQTGDATVTTPQSLGVVLWLCSVLMLLRVVGQLVVFLRAPSWLPPMAQWQSGLVPYGFLLFTQGVVLVLMFSIAADFTRNAGFWVRPMPVLGRYRARVELYLRFSDGRPLRGQDGAPA